MLTDAVISGPKVPMKPVVTELAWAAGFFDGEGHVSASKQSGKRACGMRLQIAQTDPRVLERFHVAVGGLGRVRGPNNYGWKDVWSYRASRFEHCQAIVVMLWPFLSQQKREDAAEALAGMRDWFAEKAATCRRGLHNLAEVGLTKVGSCAECDRENRRAKYAAANQPGARKMCKSGKHEMTPMNTYIWREVNCCRACRAGNKRGVSGHREKRERVAAALKEDGSRSNRELARLLGVSHGLVGRVRNDA